MTDIETLRKAVSDLAELTGRLDDDLSGDIDDLQADILVLAILVLMRQDTFPDGRNNVEVLKLLLSDWKNEQGGAADALVKAVTKLLPLAEQLQGADWTVPMSIGLDWNNPN